MIRGRHASERSSSSRSLRAITLFSPYSSRVHNGFLTGSYYVITMWLLWDYYVIHIPCLSYCNTVCSFPRISFGCSLSMSIFPNVIRVFLFVLTSAISRRAIICPTHRLFARGTRWRLRYGAHFAVSPRVIVSISRREYRTLAEGVYEYEHCYEQEEWPYKNTPRKSNDLQGERI